MRKKVFGRQLKRDINERNALFKSLMRELVLRESITTTEAKAKAIKGQVEKFVTKAKKNAEEASRLLQSHFAPDALRKLVSDVAPRFATRSGGYTRIIKVGNRINDNAKMVILEWVEKKEKKPQMQAKKEVQEKPTEVAEAAVTVAKEEKPKKTTGKKKSETKEKKVAVKKTKTKEAKKKTK